MSGRLIHRVERLRLRYELMAHAVERALVRAMSRLVSTWGVRRIVRTKRRQDWRRGTHECVLHSTSPTAARESNKSAVYDGLSTSSSGPRRFRDVVPL